MTEYPVAHLKMTLNFKERLTVFSLVFGGWFPLALTTASVHVIDRNVLIWIRKFFKGSKGRSDFEANRWWLDFLDQEHQQINPIHCAFEGEFSRAPTFNEFKHEYLRSSEELSEYFPKAKITRHSDNDFESLYRIVDAVKEKNARDANFLCDVASLISERKSEKIRISHKEIIIQNAIKNGVENSMVLIAVISCLYEGAKKESAVAARKLIKPSAVYDFRTAYNALADIRALEMLAAGSSLPGKAVGFCTMDRPLSAFWCHLGIGSSEWVDGSCRLSFDLSPNLFPTLKKDEIDNLFYELKECGLFK